LAEELEVCCSDPISIVLSSGEMSRAVGVTVMGACAGIAIGLVEEITKTSMVAHSERLTRRQGVYSISQSNYCRKFPSYENVGCNAGSLV